MHPTMNRHVVPLALAALALPAAARAQAQAFSFSTNDPDGRMAAATHPETPGVLIDHETGDDFILTARTTIESATFTGLIPANAKLSDIRRVVIEIYRVFPFDSDQNRTIGVPTRANSPGDVAFDERSSEDGSVDFRVVVVSDEFTALNSVATVLVPRGGGEGQVSGREVRIEASIPRPFNLPAGHYFFVPQVELEDGVFMWLSAPRPIVAPGTPLTLDLQAWTRDANLDPDWLRIGADIVGGNPAPAFNMTFSLHGGVVGGEGGCACDWNTDGLLNSQDFFDYLSAFFTAPNSADFNGNGVTDAQDFFDFLNCFFAGCDA